MYSNDMHSTRLSFCDEESAKNSNFFKKFTTNTGIQCFEKPQIAIVVF